MNASPRWQASAPKVYAPIVDRQQNGCASRREAGYSVGENHLDRVAEQLTINDLRELIEFALATADQLGEIDAGIWLDRAVVALEDRVLDAAVLPV